MMTEPHPTHIHDMSRDHVMVQILLGLRTDELRVDGERPGALIGAVVDRLRAAPVMRTHRYGAHRACILGSGRRLIVPESRWAVCDALLSSAAQQEAPEATTPAQEAVHRLPEADTPEGCIERARLAERAAMRVLQVDEEGLVQHARAMKVRETSARGRITVALEDLAKQDPEAHRHWQQAQRAYLRAALHPATAKILRARARRLRMHPDDALAEMRLAALTAAQRYRLGEDSWRTCLRLWCGSRAYKLKVSAYQHAGSTQVQLADKIRHLKGQARAANIQPTVEDLAEQTGSTVDKVREALALAPMVSLDTPATEDGRSLLETVDDTSRTEHQEDLEKQERAIARFWEHVLHLVPAQAWVTLRHGGVGQEEEQEVSWKALAGELGVSRPHTLRLYAAAVEHLQTMTKRERATTPPHSRESYEALLQHAQAGHGLSGRMPPGPVAALRFEILRTARSHP